MKASEATSGATIAASLLFLVLSPVEPTHACSIAWPEPTAGPLGQGLVEQMPGVLELPTNAAFLSLSERPPDLRTDDGSEVALTQLAGGPAPPGRATLWTFDGETPADALRFEDRELQLGAEPDQESPEAPVALRVTERTREAEGGCNATDCGDLTFAEAELGPLDDEGTPDRRGLRGGQLRKGSPRDGAVELGDSLGGRGRRVGEPHRRRVRAVGELPGDRRRGQRERAESTGAGAVSRAGALAPAAAERKPGLLKGRIRMARDFDEALPDHVLAGFDGGVIEPAE